MKAAIALLALALVGAGCVNVYESEEPADEHPVECHVAGEEERRAGAPNPLRCELANGSNST